MYQHSDTKTKGKRQVVISDSNCISGFVCTLQNHQNLQWLNGDLGLEKKKKNNTGDNFRGNIRTNFMTSTHLVLQRPWCLTLTEDVLWRGDKPSEQIARQATWKYSWRMPLGPQRMSPDWACLAAPSTAEFSSSMCCPGVQAASQSTHVNGNWSTDRAVLTAALMAACRKAIWT